MELSKLIYKRADIRNVDIMLGIIHRCMKNSIFVLVHRILNKINWFFDYFFQTLCSFANQKFVGDEDFIYYLIE